MKTEENKLIAEFMGFQKPEIGQSWDYGRQLDESRICKNLVIESITDKGMGMCISFEQKMPHESYGIEYFDGRVFWPSGTNSDERHTPLKSYRTSWNWLMPVVEKIESDHNVMVDIHREATKIKVYKGDTKQWDLTKWDQESKISHVYKSVIAFIKYFNELNKPQ